MKYVLVRKSDRKEWNFKWLVDLLDQLFLYLIICEKMPLDDAKTIINWFHEHDRKGTEFNFITGDYEFIIRAEKGEKNV